MVRLAVSWGISAPMIGERGPSIGMHTIAKSVHLVNFQAIEKFDCSLFTKANSHEKIRQLYENKHGLDVFEGPRSCKEIEVSDWLVLGKLRFLTGLC